MKRTLTFIILATACCGSPTFAAESVGGKNEKLTEITGKVVDLLCEVAKRCAPDCGGGKRQLGILQADGKLLPVVKNADLFAGAQADLAPLCGRTVVLDGVLFENAAMPVFLAQGIKTDPAAKEFTPAEAFIKAWVARNGASDEWFRNDALTKEAVAKNGPLGKPGLQPKPQ